MLKHRSTSLNYTALIRRKSTEVTTLFGAWRTLGASENYGRTGLGVARLPWAALSKAGR
jgi:hypothetical protein